MEKELNKEELLFWFSWLRKVAKETNIWANEYENDEIAYRQIKQIIEKTRQVT